MTAINNSISYQSQFAPTNTYLGNFRTKIDGQPQMELMKGVDLKPASHKYHVQILTTHGELGKYVNLKA